MPAISRKGDTVMSPDGVGRDCARPVETAVDEVNGNSVFANNILIVVQGNKIAPHNKGGCDPDESVLSTFSPNVFIGNKNVGRIGDQYGDNTITQGSPNVFAN
jgi:ribosomal protein L27